MADDTLTRAEEEALARARRSVDARARGGSRTRSASTGTTRKAASSRKAASGKRRATSGGQRPGTRRTRAGRGRRGRGPSRSLTLDTARGVLVALTATVVVAGDPALLPASLRPAAWNGFGVADLLPVGFTVIVGVSLAHQLAGRGRAGTGWWTARLARRVAVLVGVGLLLSWLHTADPATVRFTGPLTRIAVGGVLAWLVATRLSVRGQAAVAIGLTAGHWFLLGRGVLGAGGAVARVERDLLGAHGVAPLDPDGLVALGPTVVAILGGVWIGQWLQERPAGPATVAAFGLAGVYTVVGALGWAQLLPVNAALWTGPTLFLGAGVVLLLLALSHLLVEVVPGRRPVSWVTALGAEALPVYALAVAFLALRERTGVGAVWDSIHTALAEPLLGAELGTVAMGALATSALARVAVALTERGRLLRA